MDIVYYDPYPNKFLEEYIRDYGKLLESKGEPPVTITKLDTVEDVLKAADVSLLLCFHFPLENTAILVSPQPNVNRGPKQVVYVTLSNSNFGAMHC